MKKITAFLLAALLVVGIAVPASAEEGLLIAPNPISATIGYAYTLIVNDDVVDTSAYPQAEGIPMEALAKADHSSTYFDEESKTDTGYFEGGNLEVNTETGAITLDGEPVEGMTGSCVDGHTFLPIVAINLLEGYAAKQEGTAITVTTPNGAPMVKLSYSILEAAGIGFNMKSELEPMLENFDVSADNIEEGYFFGGMMTSPDCLMIAKIAEGGDAEAVKGAFEAYRQRQHDTFSWYLSQNLPKVENAKLVVKNGYVMLLIAPDSDAGLKVFNAAFPTDTYTVQKGDTMGFIALNFYGSNGYHRALTRANAEAFKATRGKLVPGMVLTLPEKLGKATRMEPAVAGEGETLYTVKLGDTLGKIAKAQYGTMAKYRDIFNRNSDRLKNAATIYEGQIIVLPAVKTVTVTVIDKDWNVNSFTYETTASNLADVLKDNKLVKGTEGPYGLYIETVNGITASWDVDQSWWQINRNGEEAQVGASSLPVNNGDEFELVYMIGAQE